MSCSNVPLIGFFRPSGPDLFAYFFAEWSSPWWNDNAHASAFNDGKWQPKVYREREAGYGDELANAPSDVNGSDRVVSRRNVDPTTLDLAEWLLLG